MARRRRAKRISGATTITSASANENENETSFAVRDTAGRTAKPRTIIGSVKALFGAAAKAVAERVAQTLRPKPRRRKKGGDDTREFFPHARHMTTRQTRPQEATLAYLSETLWLQVWGNNADLGSHAASGYNAEQSNFTPKL